MIENWNAQYIDTVKVPEKQVISLIIYGYDNNTYQKHKILKIIYPPLFEKSVVDQGKEHQI